MSRAEEPKVVRDASEAPLVLHSDVRVPLAGLGFLRRALAMAELARIAYNDEAEAAGAAGAIGFPETHLVDRDGSQAYRFGNAHDVVVACRGTQPTEWNDIRADANAVISMGQWGDGIWSDSQAHAPDRVGNRTLATLHPAASTGDRRWNVGLAPAPLRTGQLFPWDHRVWRAWGTHWAVLGCEG